MYVVVVLSGAVDEECCRRISDVQHIILLRAGVMDQENVDAPVNHFLVQHLQYIGASVFVQPESIFI